MTKTAAIIAAVAVVAMLGGSLALVYLRSGPDDALASCRGSAVATGEGSIGGPFELLDKNGEKVTDAEVLTQPSLVYFGYTFCPDVCPADTSRNAIAVDLLEERGLEVTPVFISVDPKRDTPEVVGDFAYNLHERMIGLTGTPEQISKASQAYRTYYKIHDDGDDPYYLVDHSTFTYLVMPEEGFVDFFRREATPEEMADRVACFIEASSAGSR